VPTGDVMNLNTETAESTPAGVRTVATTSCPVLYRRVVACVDGAAVGEAVRHHAMLVADALAASLTLLCVLEAPDADAAPLDPLEWDVRIREARAHLKRLTSGVPRSLVTVDTEVAQGRAAEQICAWAEEHEGDLMVIASHGEHRRAQWLLSGTAHKLIEGAPGSLLLVPAAGPSSLPDRYRRILLPLDGSSRAEVVLPMAVRLAAAHQSEIVLAHVVPTPELTGMGPMTAQDIELERAVVARNERVARAYLDQVKARLTEAGVAARVLLVRGDVRTRLAHLVAREQIDLIALSAFGRHGPRDDAPCGSVPSHLLTHAAVPVLMVRQASGPHDAPAGRGRRPPRAMS
jgi:nucleotide-binding universal stress UspA family protein